MSLSLVDINSTVVQSAGVAGGGIAAHFIDSIFPDPKVLTSTAQIPLVAAEIVGQIALNGVTVKLLADSMNGWTRNTSMMPLMAALVFPLVQPRLMKKLFYFYTGLGTVLDASMAKLPPTGPRPAMVNNPSTKVGGVQQYASQPATTQQINDAVLHPTFEDM